MTSTAPRTAAARPAAPPLVLTRARLGAGGPPVSLRVDGGRITAVVPAAERPPLRTGERVVDLDGRTVLPGLRDAHVHMTQWAGTRRRTDLSAARSARQAADAVAAATAGLPPGEIFLGCNFRDGLWPDAPHRDLLDAAAPGRPVALVGADLHAVWMNSACLALIGADHPTGLLREQACMAALAALPEADEETADRWVAQACEAAAARGVTGVTDFEYADNLANWTRRTAAAAPAVRVSASVWSQHLESAIERGLRTGDPVPGADPLVRMGPLKMITDGSLNTRTALCYDPYPGLAGQQDAHGLELVPSADLVRLMRRAAAHGIEPAVHAIGDRANAVVLDAFAEVRCRGRVEHAQLLTPADVPRFAELGVTAGVQPEHAVDDRDVADRHWAGRTGRAFPYRDLLDAGARLEFGSDAPVAPLDPWRAIAAAVHRSADDRPSWHPEQEIPVRDALTAACGGRRLVRVGDRADLAVVDTDPLTADAAALRAMPVHATLLAGRWTYGGPED
ncbi:amidohydrolase family protein [Streptomyces sp. NPDC008150]|uniref:amidohydrolase n=1 Tax=Streptomyces sp. NPDC008150 TaxID=3364816 RepID=UPI0036EE3185